MVSEKTATESEWTMLFRLWIKKEGLTEAQAAELLDVSQAAIHRYCKRRVPRPEIILRIKKVSRGQVSEKDWYSEKFLTSNSDNDNGLPRASGE